jgi:hypothetical protein
MRGSTWYGLFRGGLALASASSLVALSTGRALAATCSWVAELGILVPD